MREAIFMQAICQQSIDECPSRLDDNFQEAMEKSTAALVEVKKNLSDCVRTCPCKYIEFKDFTIGPGRSSEADIWYGFLRIYWRENSGLNNDFEHFLHSTYLARGSHLMKSYLDANYYDLREFNAGPQARPQFGFPAEFLKGVGLVVREEYPDRYIAVQGTSIFDPTSPHDVSCEPYEVQIENLGYRLTFVLHPSNTCSRDIDETGQPQFCSDYLPACEEGTFCVKAWHRCHPIPGLNDNCDFEGQKAPCLVGNCRKGNWYDFECREYCFNDVDCDGNSYCDTRDNLCGQKMPVGSSCIENRECLDSYCFDYKCVPFLDVGDECDPSSSLCNVEKGLFCDTVVDQNGESISKCALMEGKDCVEHKDCLGSVLFCKKDSGDANSGVCTLNLENGEPCDKFALDRSCQSGVCEYSDFVCIDEDEDFFDEEDEDPLDN